MLTGRRRCLRRVDLSELAGCVGVTAQLANDLQDGELMLYGACDREELTRAVMQRVLVPR